MVWKTAILRNIGSKLGFRRYTPIVSHSLHLDCPTRHTSLAPHFVLPESDRNPNTDDNKAFRFDFPSFSFAGGSMELMAVPKRKVSPHKRGIRNGPKALKPVPVIVRCNACGRVKLPHFFCCSGIRGNPNEHSGSNS